MGGEIGKITSVDFTWYLDTPHGADYFRRWHRLRSKSGSLWVHKAIAPLRSRQLVDRRRARSQVSAFGSLQRTTARAGPSAIRPAAAARTRRSAAIYWDITKDKNLSSSTTIASRPTAITRDGCVFKEDIDIFDTMNAVVRYSNGVDMSYSVNAFMPIEGYHLAFNGTEGPARGARLRAPGVGSRRRNRDVRDEELRPAREDRAAARDRGATAAAISGCAI